MRAEQPRSASFFRFIRMPGAEHYVTADFSLNHATHQGALPGGCDSEPICCG